MLNKKITSCKDKYICKEEKGANMLTFNPENQTYSKLIHIDEFPEMQKKMEQIAERVKNAPVFPVANYESEAELCIDCVDEIQKMIETENFQINTPINRRRATLFLVACYFCSTIEPIKYLLEQGSEINRTDIFGYNAIMSVILNENMTDELKLDVIQMLIDKGCDVNWLNYQRETALLIALERIEIDIVNLLLDNGAVIYKE